MFSHCSFFMVLISWMQYFFILSEDIRVPFFSIAFFCCLYCHYFPSFLLFVLLMLISFFQQSFFKCLIITGYQLTFKGEALKSELEALYKAWLWTGESHYLVQRAHWGDPIWHCLGLHFGLDNFSKEESSNLLPWGYQPGRNHPGSSVVECRLVVVVGSLTIQLHLLSVRSLSSSLSWARFSKSRPFLVYLTREQSSCLLLVQRRGPES